VKMFSDKAEACIHYFNSMFKELARCHFEEIMQVLSSVPSLITEEMNDILEVDITYEKKFSTLNSFKRSKSNSLAPWLRD
jgi:hypothetical protein